MRKVSSPELKQLLELEVAGAAGPEDAAEARSGMVATDPYNCKSQIDATFWEPPSDREGTGIICTSRGQWDCI